MNQFFLQTTSQTLTHRLWRYAVTQDEHLFYPEGICTDAQEVGPYTGLSGPGLVHLTGCQLTACQVNAWIAGGSSSSAAIVRSYWMGESPREAPNKEALLQQLSADGPPADGGPLRLQCCPRTMEAWLGDELPASWNLQPVNPAWVLNIVEVPAQHGQQQGQHSGGGEQPHAQQNGQPNGQQEGRKEGQQNGQGKQQQQQEEEQQKQKQEEQQEGQQQEEEVPPPMRYLYSFQPASTLYNLAPVRGKRVPDQLCRAAGKLAEMLQVVGLELTTGVALDLGAAPGGWTHVLAQQAQHVIAVDPAEMDPKALGSGGVTHLACKAEDAVPKILEIVGDAGLGLIAADVNKHPSQVVDMMRPLLPLLHPGAAVIMTLKFFGWGKGRELEWQGRIAQELGPGFERVQLLWLLANTRHEQTCIAFKSAVVVAEAADGGAAAVGAAADVPAVAMAEPVMPAVAVAAAAVVPAVAAVVA